MAWEVALIQAKIKSLTGDSGLDDTILLGQINHFYQNVLPLELHLTELEVTLSQTLAADTTSYAVDPDSYFSVSGPAYIDDLTAGYIGELRFREDWAGFWSDFPEPTAAGSYTTQLPSQVLYHKHTLYPRPVPDDSYIMTMEAYQKPDALTTGAPLEEIWGPILAYDVAMDILMDRQDTDPIEGLVAARKFYLNKITSKEILQLGSVRAIGSI